MNVSKEEKKEQIVELFSSYQYKPMKQKELFYLFQVPKDRQFAFLALLEELMMDGRIMKTAGGKYQLVSGVYRTGTFIPHEKGFGFVELSTDEEDLFVPADCVKQAFYKDLVLCRIMKPADGMGKHRAEAEVVSILKHQMKDLVGTFEQGKSYGFVRPDNQKILQDIFIPKKYTKDARQGQKVVIAITDYGTQKKNPEGMVMEVLGHSYEPGVDVVSVVKNYALPVEFPKAVMAEISGLADTVHPKEIAGRADYRDVLTVTIDGEDAKDLDDAVTIRRLTDGYELGVHIADVSQYVPEHSLLDQEALKRGTSVYLVDRVIPMLPAALSNGICSLNEGVDRLALSCVMRIDGKGTVVDHKICESVICVNHRMTYTDVDRIITEHDASCIQRYEDCGSLFEDMLALSNLLREKRRKRGAVDFEFPETKITLSQEGEPVAVAPYERNRAHLIIEDFMLAANETVAEEFFWRELPFVYRVHEAPDSEKIKSLSIMMENFGYYFKASKDGVHAKEIQKLLDGIAGTKEEAMLSRLTLRSMRQAKYATVCTGHFGLATNYYCHFTSPIRRYPDLQIHRIIKEALHGKLTVDRIAQYDRLLPGICEDNSKKERRAADCERDVEKMKKAQYMLKHIGEVYTGVISGVTAWGLYVELPNTVEGLVHVTNLLDDYYFFDEANYAMIGRETGRTYTLGMKLDIVVDYVDKSKWQINFLPAETI